MCSTRLSTVTTYSQHHLANTMLPNWSCGKWVALEDSIIFLLAPPNVSMASEKKGEALNKLNYGTQSMIYFCVKKAVLIFTQFFSWLPAMFLLYIVFLKVSFLKVPVSAWNHPRVFSSTGWTLIWSCLEGQKNFIILYKGAQTTGAKNSKPPNFVWLMKDWKWQAKHLPSLKAIVFHKIFSKNVATHWRIWRARTHATTTRNPLRDNLFTATGWNLFVTPAEKPSGTLQAYWKSHPAHLILLMQKLLKQLFVLIGQIFIVCMLFISSRIRSSSADISPPQLVLTQYIWSFNWSFYPIKFN